MCIWLILINLILCRNLHRLLYGRAVRVRCKRRQIEQHGVLAQQTTTRPAGFQNKTQVGLTHRFFGTQTHHGIGTGGLNIKTDTVEKGDTLNGETGKIILTRHMHLDLLRAHIAQLPQGNAGIQRLIKRRLENDLAETQGLGMRSGEQNHRGEDHHELS